MLHRKKLGVRRTKKQQQNPRALAGTSGLQSPGQFSPRTFTGTGLGGDAAMTPRSAD